MCYQRIFDKIKAIMKEDACMKFYNEMKLLYLETDACVVGLRVCLLQTREGMNCPGNEASHNNMLRVTVKAHQQQK